VVSTLTGSEPPAIPGVRRSFIDARGVRFHVTEAGPIDGRPVLALHGWPQHHWVYRDLLTNPPPGLRIIAPDLPGYGWSGPPPHRWAKQDVANDVLALMDVLGLQRALLVGHDWGGFVVWQMALMHPDRVAGVIGLTFYSVGYLGKFFSDAFESVDLEVARGLRAIGASRRPWVLGPMRTLGGVCVSMSCGAGGRGARGHAEGIRHHSAAAHAIQMWPIQ
jgi:pimeloyl-ACP methyl ester carboxylesterase